MVQHGQSEHHINNLSGGWTDTPLTELGRQQAVAIGLRFRSEIDPTFYAIYASDLKRTAQTAEIIGQQLNLEVEIDQNLREINTGVATGHTKEWANAHRNPRADPQKFDLDYQLFPEGETWREFYNRLVKCMTHIISQTEKNLIIVTHGGCVSFITAWWLQFDDHLLTQTYLSASPASISVLQERSESQRHVLRKFNDLAHLSDFRV